MNDKPLPKCIQEFFNDMYGASRDMLASHGELMPITFYIRADLEKDELIEFVPVGFNSMANDNEKDMTSLMMRQFGYRFKATAILQIMESWIAEDYKKDGSYIPPSKHPDRKEVVFFQLEIKGQKDSCSGCAYITRDANNKPSIPEEVIKLDWHGMTGRFAGILDYNPEVPTPFELGLTDEPDIPGMMMKEFRKDESDELQEYHE